MAYLVVNSKYNPFSYDELVKPLVDYTNEYNRQEELSNALLEKAASLGDLSPDVDKEAYDAYNNWKNELKAASDQLSANGLSPETRQTIRRLNSEYSSGLSPLVDKMKTRSDLVKEQRALQAKNPNIFFDTDYSTASLSDISNASTYNVYDPDSIAKTVGEDVYNRMSNGEAVPSMDEYLTRFGAGLTDENKLARINQAINSGAALGSSTYKQKEFENYIKEITAKRTYSGSRSGSSSATPQQAAGYAQAYDGHSIIPTYNKTTKQYQIKNKDKQDVVLPEDYTTDDLLRAYYGGDYGYVSALGITIPRVRTVETDSNGNQREVYSIPGAKGWINLEHGSNTTMRELYQTLYGKPLAGLSLSEIATNQVGKLGGSEEEIDKALMEKTNNNKERKRWRSQDVDYHDLSSAEIDEEVVKKLDALSEVGIDFNCTVYRDANGNFMGYKIYTSEPVDKFLTRPIESISQQRPVTPPTPPETPVQRDTTAPSNDPFRR